MNNLTLLFSMMLFSAACNGVGAGDEDMRDSNSQAETTDTSGIHISGPEKQLNAGKTVDSSGVYANERFRNVRVKRMEGNRFVVTGEGQIFEASFSWVVEDGHQQISRGVATTDAGAP